MATFDLSRQLHDCWRELYPQHTDDLLVDFIREIAARKGSLPSSPHAEETWYKDTVVYSLYVDLFHSDFPGLTERLDYLQDLGVSCLWLLPILESPMKDAGFDISNFKDIRKELVGKAPETDSVSIFRSFVQEAHSRKLAVIFDITVNHSSDEHPWFVSAVGDKNSPYRDYYIFSDTDRKYRKARLLFKGMCDSNWEKRGEEFYFHRFFETQPDLNYRNPTVLLEMCRILLFWMEQGIDGFRLDAIPFLWKEEGTNCENLPQTHILLRFMRAVVDFVRPGTLLLAEACQPSGEVVQFFGAGNECHAAYHFPLMPQIYRSLAEQKRDPILEVLDPSVTPDKPKECQWMLFLRCHDELTLEMVTKEERELLNSHYRLKDHWNFREGEGISARLSELLRQDANRIRLAFSILLTLPGSPIIYFGDEFGMPNDEERYREQMESAGYTDSRTLCRSPIDWDTLWKRLRDPASLESLVFQSLKMMLTIRKRYPLFGRGGLSWVDFQDRDNRVVPEVLAYIRDDAHSRVLIIHNLCERPLRIASDMIEFSTVAGDLLQQPIRFDSVKGLLSLPGSGVHWIPLS